MKSLNFSCNSQIEVSEFGLNDIKIWIHPALCQQFRLLVV